MKRVSEISESWIIFLAHEPSDWLNDLYRRFFTPHPTFKPADGRIGVIKSELIALPLSTERTGDGERQGLMKGFTWGGEQEIGGVSWEWVGMGRGAGLVGGI